MSVKTACVYKIVNLVNNKVYIGKTIYINPAMRFSMHKWRARSCNKKYKNDCPKLYNSIRKYGVANFIFEVLEIFENEQEALDAEEKYIIFYNSIEDGLNIAKGGCHPNGGKNNPMFQKGYLIAGKKNGMYGRIGSKNPFYGKKHNPIFLIRKSQKHSKFSDEQLADMKLMLYNKVSTKIIKKKYPTVSDKTLSLLRNGKRWKRILPELNSKPPLLSNKDKATGVLSQQDFI